MLLNKMIEVISCGGRSEIVLDNISNTSIEKSNIHGLGLFAQLVIPSHTILCLLDGQVIRWADYNDYLIEFPEWNALDKQTLLVRPIRTKYSFINHSREPNCSLAYYPLRVYSMFDIHPGFELTLDYRKEPLNADYLSAFENRYL